MLLPVERHAATSARRWAAVTAGWSQTVMTMASESAATVERGDQRAGHAGFRVGVVNQLQRQAGEQRAMLGRARTEHDYGHDEAGIEQQAGGAGEHRDAADEGGLLVCPEAPAAAGGKQDAGDAVHVGCVYVGRHRATVAGRSE